MKRFLFIIVLVSVTLALSGICFAQQKNTGCGLGSMAWEGQTGLIQQVVAVSTNGTFLNTFAITSGTSNCDRPKNYVDSEDLRKFVADNMDGLAKDIAKGSGEHLEALSVLMEVPQAGKAQWHSKLQRNFSVIYPSSQVSHIEVIKNIEYVMTSRT